MSKWVIEGKTFLITGGASGLGAALARGLLEEGAKNIAILDVAVKIGETTTEELNKIYNNKVLFFKCDVTDADNVTEVFRETLKAFKQIDVICNNAGILNDSPEYWRKACDINLKGLTHVTLEGLKHMRTDEGGAGGTIVNTSSLLGLLRIPYLPIYSGTKSAVLHLSQCLSAGSFYDTTGVRILTICYGPTSTPLVQNLEKCGYNEKIGKNLQNFHEQTEEQKVESAIKANIEMLNKGKNGSVWVSASNKPVKDITTVINEAYSIVEKAINF